MSELTKHSDAACGGGNATAAAARDLWVIGRSGHRPAGEDGRVNQ
jgi:hypothetical protein